LFAGLICNNKQNVSAYVNCLQGYIFYGDNDNVFSTDEYGLFISEYAPPGKTEEVKAFLKKYFNE